MARTAFEDVSALLAQIARAASAPEITRDELLDPSSGELRKLTLDSPIDLAALVPCDVPSVEGLPPEDRATRIIPIPLATLRHLPTRQGRALPPPLAYAFLRLFDARARYARLLELAAPDILVDDELRNVSERAADALRVARGGDVLVMRPIDFESISHNAGRGVGPEALLPSLPGRLEVGQGRRPMAPIGVTLLEREALLSFSNALVHLSLTTGHILHISPIGHYRHIATSSDERHCLFVRGGLYAGSLLPDVAVYDVSKRGFTTEYPASLPARILVSIRESKQLEIFDLREATFSALPTPFAGDTASPIANSPDGELAWLCRQHPPDEMGIFETASGNTVLLPSYDAEQAATADPELDDSATRAFVRLPDGTFRYLYDEQLVTYDSETGRERTIAVGRSETAAFARSGRRLASATSGMLRVLDLDDRGTVVDEHRFDLTSLRLHLTLDAFVDLELPLDETALLDAVGTMSNLASMDAEALRTSLTDACLDEAIDPATSAALLAAAKAKAHMLPDRVRGPLRRAPLSPLPRTLLGVSGFAENGARWISKDEASPRWIAAGLAHEGLTTLDRTPSDGDASGSLEEWLLVGAGVRARAIREPLTGIAFVVLDGERSAEIARALDRLALERPPSPSKLPESRVRRRHVEAGRALAPLLRRALETGTDRPELEKEIRDALASEDERRKLVAVYAALASRSRGLREDLEHVAQSDDDDDARRAARDALDSRD